MKNSDKPINPLYGANGVPFRNEGIDDSYVQQSDFLLGLTKREYFAAMAMQGILATTTFDPYRDIDTVIVAARSISYADALLNSL